MNIEDLVPPLELCKKIPAGEFEDSALAFACQPDDDDGEETNIFTRDMIEHLEKRWGGTPYTLYPAPTLQEILENGEPVYELTVKHKPGANQSMAENALKAWLKQKGIEE